MRSVMAGLLVVFVMVSSAGAVELGTAAKGRDFDDVRAGVNQRVRDHNKDTSGSGIRWTGILVYCECAKTKGEIAYAYDIVSGTVSATSLTKSLRVLWLFDSETLSLTLSEIARQLGMTPGGVTPILNTMVEYRLLERDAVTKHYSLGLGLLERANHVLASLDIRDAARPVLRKLAHELQANAHLAVRYEREVLYIHREEASPVVTFASIIGRRAPLHCTALGKIFLADDEELVNSILSGPLATCTPNTLTTPMALRDEIARVQESGLAVDNEEFHLDQVCFAAPVRDFRGHVAAAVSISVSKARLESERRESLEEEIIRAATEISSLLGYLEQ